MGIFDKMKKSMKHQPLMPEFDGTIAPWDCPPCIGTIAMDTDVEGVFRSLWPNALRDVKMEQWIWLEAIPADVKVPNRFGYLKDKEDMLLAYKYRGTIVGVSACCYKNVRALLERGYRVFCRAHKVDVFDDGTPRIEICSSFKSNAYEEIDLK